MIAERSAAGLLETGIFATSQCCCFRMFPPKVSDIWAHRVQVVFFLHLDPSLDQKLKEGDGSDVPISVALICNTGIM